MGCTDAAMRGNQKTVLGKDALPNSGLPETTPYLIRRVGWKPLWDKIPALELKQSYQDSPQTIHAYAQVCYNADALLVHLWAKEPHIRAVEQGLLGDPNQDSCLSFFFRPLSGDPRYLSFAFNPNGCMYLGLGRSVHDLTRLLPERTDMLFRPIAQRTEHGWEIYFQIPGVFIQRFFPNFFIGPGKFIRANCYKSGDLTTQPHYYAWNPVGGEEFTFHCPDYFGLMKLE